MFTHVSFPPFIPFLIMLSMAIGAPFVNGGNNFEHLEFNKELIKANLLQYITGSMILAVSAAVIFGLVSYFFLQKFRPDQKS